MKDKNIKNEIEEKKVQGEKRVYGYVRVSSKDQQLFRQIAELKKYVEEKNIIQDKESGKDFNRKGYQNLKENILRSGDELFIKELDRLGRDKNQVKQELRELKDMGVRVKILNIPTSMEDVEPGEEKIIDMVTEILIEVLGTIAEQEREKILQRQKEGYAQMEIGEDGKRYSVKKGKSYQGRPKVQLPENFADYYRRVENGDLHYTEVMKLLDIKKSTYYKYVKLLKELEDK